MVNEDFTVEKKEGKSFEPLPENIYQVELLDVNTEDRPTYDTRNKPDGEKIFEKVFNFQFTLLSGMDNGQSLRGRNVWENFVPTYLYVSSKHGKNKLYEVIEGLLGRSLTAEEEANGISGKQINGLIGKQVRVGVKNKKKADGKVFDNIEQYYPIETLINPLSFEEREKAQVKEKTKETPSEVIPVESVESFLATHQGDNMTETVSMDDIPVVGVPVKDEVPF